MKVIPLPNMNTNGNTWIECSRVSPPQKLVVETKIEDGKGTRNQTRLVLLNKLWFYPDMSMYVYYTPTHWRNI